jgi:hypothetical protein
MASDESDKERDHIRLCKGMTAQSNVLVMECVPRVDRRIGRDPSMNLMKGSLAQKRD